MLVNKPSETGAPAELYIGVELFPVKIIKDGIQPALAKRAKERGLLQQPISGDVYKSGLSVYMQAR
jgi:hypothetical protein